MSKIISIGTAVPANKYKQEDLYAFCDKVYANDAVESRKLRFIYKQSAIEERYSVLPDFAQEAEQRTFFGKGEDLEPFPGINKRMALYEACALDLSLEAIKDCVKDERDLNEITHLITVSCTGMSAPGLDLQIMEALSLRTDLTRSSVNFMGCYAAVHALKLANAFCNSAESTKVLIVCTELCTIHFQKEKTPDDITASLLFADGSAAAVVTNDKAAKGIKLDSFYSAVNFTGKKEMAWQISDKGFLMTLTGYVPQVIKEDFECLVAKALSYASLTNEDITHWCIHPGGKKILEAISHSLSLADDALTSSYNVLRKYGNMSSATILFVLKEMLDGAKGNTSAGKIFAAAFGPGLTMETFVGSYD